MEMFYNHIGEFCYINPDIFCQEGYCGDCAIYQASNERLNDLMEKQDAQLKMGEELIQKAILHIIQTRGILANGFSTPELDRAIKGRDD